MKAFAKMAFVLSGLFALFWIWYAIAADYDYQRLSGIYVIVRPHERCTLRLNADGSFSEKLVRSSGDQFVSGKWRRFGEAGVEFSPSFLMLSGQKSGPKGEIYGKFEKALTLFPSLVLDPEGGPRLRRRPGW
jgi:hypothetical protein